MFYCGKSGVTASGALVTGDAGTLVPCHTTSYDPCQLFIQLHTGFGVGISFFIYRAHGMQQPIFEIYLDLNLVKDFNDLFHKLVNWFLNLVSKVITLQM
jgi:hypothetical protein